MDIQRALSKKPAGGGRATSSTYGSLELADAICSCDHPDLDPTPRRGEQYSPVRRIAAVSACTSSVSKSSKVRARAKQALVAAAAESSADQAEVQHAIQELGSADGLPTRPERVDLNEIQPAAQMGSLVAVDEFSAADMATTVRNAERRLGRTGFGLRDVQLRHRNLMRGRAAANEAAAAAQDEDDAARRDGEVLRQRVPVSPEEREEERLKRLTSSPPLRFWYLLLLWLLAGVAGAHRVPLRGWPVIGIQVACVVLGSALVMIAAYTLHPMSDLTRETTYRFQEAYYVAGIGYSFAGIAVILWVRDGYLLARMRLMPTAAAQEVSSNIAANAAARSSRPRGRRGLPGACSRADAQRRGQAAILDAAANAAAISATLKQDASYRRVFVLWFFLGIPTCAHRWKIKQYGRAAFHCTMIAAAVTLNFASFIDLHVGYGFTLLWGIFLLQITATIWLRDLVQLLRGRLGPREAAAPEYWMLLIRLVFFGVAGMHRVQLGRYRSALLFPLLFVIGAFFAIDAATGLTFNALASTVNTAREAAVTASGAWSGTEEGEVAAGAMEGNATSADGNASALARMLVEVAGRALSEASANSSLGSLDGGDSSAGALPSPDDGGLAAAPSPPDSVWTEAMEMSRRELFVRLSEAMIATCALSVLSVALVRDFVLLLRGALRPKPESQLYWSIVYSWIIGGLPLGLHRASAAKVSWRIFPVLNAYGIILLCLGEIYFKDHEGDPNISPTYFARGTAIGADVLAALLLLAPLAMWLRDLPAVARGTLVYKEELVLFYIALFGWLLPSGFLGGFHFRQFGRPYDWQLFSSLTVVGVLTGVAARNYSRFAEYEITYLLTLSAGLACFGINLGRWLLDGADYRRGSLLNRQLTEAAFVKVRRLWLLGGFAMSAHQWHLGYPMATFTSLLLHTFGTVLTLIAILSINPRGNIGAAESYDTLRAVAISSLLLLLLLWLRDGVLLFLRKVDLQGESVNVIEEIEGDDDVEDVAPAAADEDEEGDGVNAQRSLDPAASWRCFRTHLGTKYYYDPTTEMIHYLSANGVGNYAVDPVYNCTVMYDSHEQLAEKLEFRGYPGYGQESSTMGVAAPTAAEQAQITSQIRRRSSIGSTSTTAKSAILTVDQQV